MGGAKWRAWRGGAFEFAQLSARKEDPDWGVTYTEASLKSLLGDGAKAYYKEAA